MREADAELQPLKETPKPFNLVLAQMEDGVLHDDLTDKLHELLGDISQHAADTNGDAKGVLSINLTFKLSEGVIHVQAEVKTVAPKQTRARTMFWLTPGNNLSAENPKQRELPLAPRRLPEPEPARQVPTPTPGKG